MRTSLLSQAGRGPSPMVWCLAVSGVLLLLAPPARAGGVVNNCTEADLRAALAGGGTVTFACDGTIVLTNELVIAQDTVMDGSGREMILDGARTNRVLHVMAGVQFTMIGLAVTNGRAQGTNGVAPLASGGIGQGGGLYSEGGDVALLDCVFTSNVAKGGDGAYLGSDPGGGDGGPGRGGAVMSEGGTVAATNCAFVASFAQGGEGGEYSPPGRQGVGGN